MGIENFLNYVVLQPAQIRTTLYYMSNTITVRLDEKLAKKLAHVAERSGRTRSDVIRDALRRQLAIAILDEVREELVPLAEKQGIYTDEDVFRKLS